MDGCSDREGGERVRGVDFLYCDSPLFLDFDLLGLHSWISLLSRSGTQSSPH